MCSPRPHAGVTRLRWRSSTGSQPRLTSSHQTSESRRQARSLVVAIGPSVATAPHAMQPPSSRNRLRYPATSTSRAIERDRQHRRAGGEERGDVGVGAAVHAHGGGRLEHRHRRRQQVDRRIGSDREAGAHQLADPRLVEPHDLRRVRAAPPRRRRRSRPDGLVRRAPRPRRRRSAGTPTRVSAAPSVTGPVNCHLTGPRQLASGGGGEEGPQAAVGVVAEVGDDGRVRVERGRRRRRCCRTGRA